MDAEAYSLHTYWTVSRLLDGGTIGRRGEPQQDLLVGDGPAPPRDRAAAARRAATTNGWLDGFLFSLSGPIYAGTNEIQRNVIAERVLGLPRS